MAALSIAPSPTKTPAPVFMTCPTCKGTGEIFDDESTRAPWWRFGFEPCHECHGAGEVEAPYPTCELCDPTAEAVVVVRDEFGSHLACNHCLTVIEGDADSSFRVVCEVA